MELAKEVLDGKGSFCGVQFSCNIRVVDDGDHVSR